MADLPTKQTLDDIERFGNTLQAYYTSMKNLFKQSIALAERYIILDDSTVDGVRTTTYHANVDLIYTDKEKAKMLEYYDFLKDSISRMDTVETSNGILLYDMFNSKTKIDSLIENAFKAVLVG